MCGATRHDKTRVKEQSWYLDVERNRIMFSEGIDSVTSGSQLHHRNRNDRKKRKKNEPKKTLPRYLPRIDTYDGTETKSQET